MAHSEKPSLYEPISSFEPVKLVFLFVYLTSMAISNWVVLAFIHDFVPRSDCTHFTAAVDSI